MTARRRRTVAHAAPAGGRSPARRTVASADPAGGRSR